MTPAPMGLTDLVGEPLVGGTLIEYRRGYGFRREHARATITRVGWHPEQRRYFVIETDSPDDANMGIALDYHATPEVWRARDGVCFWDHPIGWCYAAVPPGVPVPEAGEELDLRVERQEAACPAAQPQKPQDEARALTAPEALAVLAVLDEAQGCGAAKALAPAEESDYKSAVSKIAALATVQR